MLFQERRVEVFYLLAVVILITAFFFRVHTLDFRSLWFDEALEYWVTVAPFSEVVNAATRLTFDPPLYSYILHGWAALGQREFWLRLPSVFFSLLGLAALVHLGKRNMGWPTGLVAGLLVAFSAADVRYAQEVGQYALMVALLSWNLVFLNAVRYENSWRAWSLWAVTAVLSIYTHYGSIVVVAVTSALWLLRSVQGQNWKAVRYQWTAGVGAVVLLAPLYLVIIPAQMNRFAPHIAPLGFSDFLERSSRILLFHFVGSQVQNWTWPGVAPWIVCLPLFLPVLIAFWRVRSFIDWPVLLAGAWLLYFAFGLNAIYVFAGSRHSLLLFPLLILTMATGIVVMWRWQLMIGFIVFVVVLGLSLFAPPEAQQDLRSVTNFWADAREEDHITYVYYGAAPGFRYQLQLREEATESMPPDWYNQCWAGQSAPYCLQDDIYYGRWLRSFDATEKSVKIFETLGQRPTHFWIIFSHTSEQEMSDLLSELANDYRVALEHRASHAAAFLLERHSHVQGSG